MENGKRKSKATSISDLVYSLAQPLVLTTLEQQSREQLPTDHERQIIKMPAIVAGSRQRRRVIFTAPNWQISGVNTFIETLVNELNKLDYEAYVLFTTTQPLTEQKPLLPHMPYQLLSQESHLRPKRRKELLHNYLAAMAPCVFVPNYDYVASTVTPELQDNIATLGVLHSDDPQHYVHGYRMGPYWDAIVSVSQTIQEKLLALNPAFEKKSSVIRYGIRDGGRTIEPRQRGTNGKLRIVYTGRIIQHQKLIFDFVDVARKLNDFRDQFQMIFVGDGPDFPELQQRMAPYVQSGLVEMVGRVKPDVISDILLSSHVFALTSEFEGLPLSMLEALSAGLVPVVTDVESGIGEVCVHNQNALISPIGKPGALADNLLRLANSPELFNRLSKASRQSFLDHKLTAVDMAEQYATVLDNLFDGIREAGPVRTDKLIYCPNIERLLNVA
jgi:glycosyltransferase involved in cell wall biosynthesis